MVFVVIITIIYSSTSIIIESFSVLSQWLWKWCGLERCVVTWGQLWSISGYWGCHHSVGEADRRKTNTVSLIGILVWRSLFETLIFPKKITVSLVNKYPWYRYMIYHVSSFLSCIAICWRVLTCYFIIIAKTKTFVSILMVSCFCGRSSTLSVAWDESVWHKASSSNITSDGSSKDSRLRWNRIGWSDSCQIWGKFLSRLRCVTTTIDISGIERSSRLKMLWYMTRSQILKKAESNGGPFSKWF